MAGGEAKAEESGEALLESRKLLFEGISMTTDSNRECEAWKASVITSPSLPK